MFSSIGHKTSLKRGDNFAVNTKYFDLAFTLNKTMQYHLRESGQKNDSWH